MFSHILCLSHFGLIVTKLILITKNAAISLFFIAQRAVKAWITENCQKNMKYGQLNANFIDFLK